MNFSTRSKDRRVKSVIWEVSVVVALASLCAFSGCGGYKTASGSSMPGQPGYHPMHRLVQPPAGDSGARAPLGN